MPLANVVPQNHLIALLVEDDDNDVLLIRRAVKRFGMVERLIAVSSGEEAIAYLESDHGLSDRQRYPLPDVAVLDQVMPRWSGLDVLLWLRSSPRFHTLPVVILSLGLSPAQAQAAQLLKAAYCAKTTHLEELPAAIDQAIHCTVSRPGQPKPCLNAVGGPQLMAQWQQLCAQAKKPVGPFWQDFETPVQILSRQNPV